MYAVRAAQYGVGMVKVKVMVVQWHACIAMDAISETTHHGVKTGAKTGQRRRVPPDLADPVG